MSTLKASRADNFYFPPEYDAVGGSINKFQNSHPLGVRAKDIEKGILVVRYETPFHVKCKKCENMIGKGVRFNAKKKQVGNFHTTKIWEFAMTCPICKNLIVCRTDPEKCEYRYIEGAYAVLNTENATDGEFLPNREEKEKLLDPLVQLENEKIDMEKAEIKKPIVKDLYNLQSDRSLNHFDINLQMLRKFKDDNKIIKKKEIEDKKPKNFALRLVTPQTEDRIQAKQANFKQLPEAKKNMIKSREKVRSEDIFLKTNIKYDERETKNEISKSIVPTKKVKVSESNCYYTSQQIQKSKEVERLQQKLNKLPKSTQKIFKLQIKQHNANKFASSHIQLQQQQQQQNSQK